MNNFKTLWPGGNTTAIVEEFVPRALQAQLAKDIMRANSTIEQVGFLEEPSQKSSACRLQMMGGEFCVNATRSAAYLYARKNNLNEVKIEVSGSSNPLTVTINGENTITSLPSDFYIGQEQYENYTVINLKGIRHIILEGKFDENTARSLLEKHKDHYEAVGVIYTHRKDEQINIDPLVWVRETDTFVRETGCGSGSIAAAIAAHNGSNLTRFAIVQPSGEIYWIYLRVEEKIIKEITLEGIVRML